jgi:hypothetical protein
MVTLNPDRGSSLTLILNAAPDREGGVGGWQATDTAGRRPRKWFQGTPDDTMSLDCTIDIDAIGGPSVERRLRVLRDMGLPDEDDDPPTITVDGDVWSEDQSVTWVMSNLTLGDRIYQPDGTLRRQQVTVELERFTDPGTIEPLRVKSTRTSSNKRRHRVVVTRSGDTLRTVALRELGSATRWKDLRGWNAKLKSIDPDLPLRTGTHIAIKG